MSEITLIATAKYGLEQLVAKEARALGFENVETFPGRVEFDATISDIPKANLWLRCAERVRVKIGEFMAETFEELFEQTKSLDWEDWITEDGKFTVTGKCAKSTLMSVRSSQAIVKKAVVARLGEHYDTDWFEETGAAFTINVSIFRNVAMLTIDTSGEGLNKRGYREASGEAPLKETLAAGMVMLSDWQPGQRLLDPMCGSGTILIEAAMIARNIAPGLTRKFASEEWPIVGETAWYLARKAAREAILPSEGGLIRGTDALGPSIAIAKRNAVLAGVVEDVAFAQRELKDTWIDQQFGTVITNPPYGKRMSDFEEINELYKVFNNIFKKKKGWGVYVISADKYFPKWFHRGRPTGVTKFLAGTIETNYYQYPAKK